MKVTFLNKQLRNEYCTYLSIISSIITISVLFVNIPQDIKLPLGAFVLFFLIFLYLAIWFRANNLNELSIIINNSTIQIKEGDIFQEIGFKIIPFNEYFDTDVNSGIISSNTLNGKYIAKFYQNRQDLDHLILSDKHSSQFIIKEQSREFGKTKQYKLGTIIKDRDFFLLAFSRFDEHNRAYLTVDELISTLTNMWTECDIHYNGNDIVLPLLGSGLTRLQGLENISDQELLMLLLFSLKITKIKFADTTKIKIILTKERLRKIDLYEIKHRLNP